MSKNKVSISKLFRQINNVLCIDAELINQPHEKQIFKTIYVCDYGDIVLKDDKKLICINCDKVIRDFEDRNSLINIIILLKPYNPESIDLVFVALIVFLLSNVQATYEVSEHYANNAAGIMNKLGVDSGETLQFYYDKNPDALSQKDNLKDTYITNLFKCYKVIDRLSK